MREDVREDVEELYDLENVPVGQEALDELVEVLALERIEENIYRGWHPRHHLPRTFGGQTAAQALMAAYRTVPEGRDLHSMHSYFLRGGDPTVPALFLVDRVRDGGSFTTRRVLGVQHGETIYALTVSFQKPEPGVEHADEMPDAPDPESLPTFAELVQGYASEVPVLAGLARNIDVRYVDPPPFMQRESGPRQEPYQRVWMRAYGKLPDDPRIHAAVIAYVSDISLLSSVLVKHGLAFSLDPLFGASLDHAVWFHRPFRADEWFLYDTYSPWAGGARGLAIGRMFTRDGVLGASVVQEGLLRPMGELRERLTGEKVDPLAVPPNPLYGRGRVKE